MMGTEVKTGKAVQTKEQRVFDNLLNQSNKPFLAVGDKAREAKIKKVDKAILITKD